MDAGWLRIIEDPARLAALDSTGLLDAPAEASLDRLTRLASSILEAPVALVSLVDDDRQFFASQVGLGEPFLSARQTPLSHSFCKHVVIAAQPLIVSDARRHPVVRDNPAIKELGVIAYLGMPLTTSGGDVLGSFCAIDVKEHEWTERTTETLKDLAALVMTEIELRMVARRYQADFMKLRRAEEERDDLVHMLVHDLRNPLNSLIGGLELAHAQSEDENLKEALGLARKGGRSLAEMVTSILEVSKAEAGRMKLELAEIAPRAVVESATQQLAQLAALSTQELTIDIAEGIPTILADGTKLRRTLVNLIANAIQHTPRRGRIAVAVRKGDADEAVFEVADNGYGIPKESFGLIFEKFGQVKARRMKAASTGLGLPLCKMVVEAHGGRIWVESEMGKGSTFRIAIPVRPKE